MNDRIQELRLHETSCELVVRGIAVPCSCWQRRLTKALDGWENAEKRIASLEDFLGELEDVEDRLLKAEAELADALVQLARLRERERIAAIREHLAHWALDADHEDVLALVPEWMKAEATAHLPHVWSLDAALTQENPDDE